MPILIDEVVISVQVENHPASTSSAPNKQQQKQAIVEACVQQVLEILKQQEEP